MPPKIPRSSPFVPAPMAADPTSKLKSLQTRAAAPFVPRTLTKPGSVSNKLLAAGILPLRVLKVKLLLNTQFEQDSRVSP